MKSARPRSTDPTKILTRREMAVVLTDLRRKTPRSRSTRMNLVIFRLACCCGLRASEIAQLTMAEVRIELSRPYLKIRVGAAKGGYSRTVPLTMVARFTKRRVSDDGETIVQVPDCIFTITTSWISRHRSNHRLVANWRFQT
jgi:site-specific recombinase XerD